MQLPLYLMFMQEYIRHFVKTVIRVVAYIRDFVLIIRQLIIRPTNMDNVYTM